MSCAQSGELPARVQGDAHSTHLLCNVRAEHQVVQRLVHELRLEVNRGVRWQVQDERNRVADAHRLQSSHILSLGRCKQESGAGTEAQHRHAHSTAAPSWMHEQLGVPRTRAAAIGSPHPQKPSHSAFPARSEWPEERRSSGPRAQCTPQYSAGRLPVAPMGATGRAAARWGPARRVAVDAAVSGRAVADSAVSCSAPPASPMLCGRARPHTLGH